jgi:hypothetical protein
LTSEIFDRILELVARGEVVISDHGYDELAADGILVRDILTGAREGKVIEDYPKYYQGPCVLVLQQDHDGKPVHVVWGIPSHAEAPAVVVTAYRPDARRWTSDFLRRRS